jgi:ketopantoate reductase
MGPRIAIMGVGALGGNVGAHMAKAREDVTFIDPSPEHVEADAHRRPAYFPICARRQNSPSRCAHCI